MLVTLGLSESAKGISKSSISAVSGIIIRTIISTIQKCFSNIKSTLHKKIRKSLIELDKQEPSTVFMIRLPALSEREFSALVQTLISERELLLQYVLTKNNAYRPTGFTGVPRTLKTYSTRMRVGRVIAVWDSLVKSYSDRTQMDRILKDIKSIKKIYHDTKDEATRSALDRVGKSLFDVVKFIIRYRNLQTEVMQGIVEEFNRITKANT